MGHTIGSQIGAYDEVPVDPEAEKIETSPENPLPPDAPSTDPGGVVVEGPSGPIVVTDPTPEKVQEAIDAQHAAAGGQAADGTESTPENPTEAAGEGVQTVTDENGAIVEQKVEPGVDENGDPIEEAGEPVAGEPKVEEAESFNPTDHSVAEVMEYLKGADDAEKKRVQKAEGKGKARSTILNA